MMECFNLHLLLLNTDGLLSTYSVPGTTLYTLRYDLISSCSVGYDTTHFMDLEPEEQKGQVACPESHSWMG